MDENNDVLATIMDSFLSKDKKAELVAFYNEHGATEAFYSLFNAFLIAKTDIQVELFENLTSEYNTKCAELDKKYAQKKASIEKVLEESLATLNRSELLQRKAVVGTYYKNLQEILEEKRKELLVLNAHQIYPLVQNSYQEH